MKVQVSLSMGRSLQSMTNLVDSLQDVVQEHLWKLFAYHKVRPQDVKGWKRSVDKYIPRLQKYNIQKDHSNRKNLERADLEDKFVTELFEDGDIDLLNMQWSHKGFPKQSLTDNDKERLRSLARKFVTAVLAESDVRLKTDESDLL